MSHGLIAAFALVGIACHLILRFAPGTAPQFHSAPWVDLPLLAVLATGGVALVGELLFRLGRGELGSDLLAGVSIATSVVLGEYLAGTVVVLMLSSGLALESYAVRRASSALLALARRVPSRAHRKNDEGMTDLPIEAIAVDEVLVVLPHETCPVDGTVIEGHGTMDESYLTGEPYVMSKVPGSAVLSGTINGPTALVIRAEKRADDSRYAKIMRVMRESEQARPRLRRLGDQLGAVYTPLALGIAILAWVVSGHSLRFLAVLVVATPCPLLIGIPVAIIGAISLAARHGIIIKDPSVLERIDGCRTAIFDKTGTLTYGRPKVTEVVPAPGFSASEVLQLVGSLERYSRHPLAAAVVAVAAEAGVSWSVADEMSERPGEGLRGSVNGRSIQITSRKILASLGSPSASSVPTGTEGMECVVLVDGCYAATLRFRDEPRAEGSPFVLHLKRRHHFERLLLVSGDRESESRYLAERVGIQEVYASRSPEQKLELVRAETRRAPTVFLGDGINDAPALAAATVGIAFGTASDVTTEAAGAVVLDSSLQRVDELLHIGRRMRSIALQSAIGGMALSVVGMVLAAAGYLPPVTGAIAQEVIDIAAVANAMRAAISPKVLSDY